MNLNWTSILENVIAGSIIAFLFGIFLTWLMSWRNRLIPKIVVNIEGPTKEGWHWLSINITNEGKQILRERELNWHIYWPHNVEGFFIDELGKKLEKNQDLFKKAGESNIDGMRHSHLCNWSKAPVNPGKEIPLLKFRLDRFYKSKELKIRYEFSTIDGTKPKRVWHKWRWVKIYDKNGFPKLELLPNVLVRDIGDSKYKGKSFIPPEQMSDRFL